MFKNHLTSSTPSESGTKVNLNWCQILHTFSILIDLKIFLYRPTTNSLLPHNSVPILICQMMRLRDTQREGRRIFFFSFFIKDASITQQQANWSTSLSPTVIANWLIYPRGGKRWELSGQKERQNHRLWAGGWDPNSNGYIFFKKRVEQRWGVSKTVDEEWEIIACWNFWISQMADRLVLNSHHI